MDREEKESTKVLALLPLVQQEFTRRLKTTNWHEALENFGLLKAIACGMLTDRSMNIDIAVHARSSNPFSVRHGGSPGTWLQLEKQLLLLLESCDAEALERLAANMWAVEAAGQRLFHEAVFMRRQWWKVDNEIGHTVSQRMNFMRQGSYGPTFDTDTDAVEAFVVKHAKARKEEYLGFALFSSARTFHPEDDLAKEVFGPFGYRAASADEALSLVRHSENGSHRPWSPCTRIWVTGTVGKVERKDALLCLTRTNERGHSYCKWRISLELAPEHLSSLLGGLGDDEWLLGVRPIGK